MPVKLQLAKKSLTVHYFFRSGCWSTRSFKILKKKHTPWVSATSIHLITLFETKHVKSSVPKIFPLISIAKTSRRVGNRTRVHCDFSYERVVADMVKTRYFRGWVEGNDRNWLVICITTWFSWVKTHIRTSKSHGNFLTMFEDSCVLP